MVPRFGLKVRLMRWLHLMAMIDVAGKVIVSRFGKK
jgi:hypothetical protein